jgi:hypothetical protein
MDNSKVIVTRIKNNIDKNTEYNYRKYEDEKNDMLLIYLKDPDVPAFIFEKMDNEWQIYSPIAQLNFKEPEKIVKNK